MRGSADMDEFEKALDEFKKALIESPLGRLLRRVVDWTAKRIG